MLFRAGLWRLPVFGFRSRIDKAGTVTHAGSLRLRNTYRLRPVGDPGDGRRFIISADINNIYSGLGCCLSVLAPCWNYARQTGRTLVIDWRDNPFTRETPETNLFPLLFETSSGHLAGVPCIADETVTGFPFPQPVLGPAETIPLPSGGSEHLPAGGLDLSAYRGILDGCADVDFPTLLPSLQATFAVRRHQSGLDPARLNQLYRALEPKQRWADEIRRYAERHSSDQPVIGVHLRHGNGEQRFVEAFGRRVIRDFPEFVEVTVDRVRRHGAARFPGGFKVFLCTDSDDAVAAFRQKLPTVVTREQWRPPPEGGVSHDRAGEHPAGPEAAAGDALIDMYLLAKCDSVLITRESELPAVVPYILEKPGAQFFDHTQIGRL